MLEQRAVLEAQAGAEARVRSRSVLAQADAQQLGAGQTIGFDRGRSRSRLDHPPRQRSRQPGSHRAGRRRSRARPRVSECCDPAPPVLEFDAEGNLVGSWGGQGPAAYEWPESNHGIVVDHKGFVWIGGNGGPDAHILKFTRDGKFVAQYGKAARARIRSRRPTSRPTSPTATTWTTSAASPRSSSTPRPTRATWPTATSTTASRSSTSTPARSSGYWGAYGKPPTDEALPPLHTRAQPPAQQFRNPVHCAEMSNDGMVYVCDRPNDRVQVFTKDGKFVTEHFIHKTPWRTARCGTSPSRRTRSSSSSTWPTAPTSTCASSTASR